MLAFVLGAFALHAAAGSDLSSDEGGPLKHGWLLVVAVLAVGTWVLAVRLHGWQDQEPEAGPRTGRLLTLLVPGVILLGVAGSVAVFLLGTRTYGRDQLPQPHPTATLVPGVGRSVSAAPVPQRPAQQHPVDLRWLLIVLAALAGVAALAFLVRLVLRLLPLLRRPGTPPPPVSGTDEGETEQRVLAEAVRLGRAALAGQDARAAIIACYAAMEESLAESGVHAEIADTPEDLLRRAGTVLAGPAAPELAALFREARYSTHPLGPAELARAEAALDDISGQLADRRREVTA
ncbi:DUF4129 domain-containing protein [Streptacidiphilus monticola]